MTVKFVGAEEVAHTIYSFYFEATQPLKYSAGQFIELTIPHENTDSRGVKRWFTLSSAPTASQVSITTRIFPERHSSFKQALCELQPGDEVHMSQPMGDFVLPRNVDLPLVFVAGGIGVTPFHSMIEWLHTTKQHRSIQLIYAASVIEEVAFRKLFRDYGLPTHILLSNPPSKWDGDSGKLTAQKILEIAPDINDKRYYLSGPEPLVEALTAELAEYGVKKDSILTDYFPNYSSL